VSLSAALMTAAMAGSIVTLEGEAPPQSALPEALEGGPDWQVLGRGEVFSEAGWGEADTRAIDQLAAELEGVQPLILELDGELKIMKRLDRALAQVTVVRDQADRALIYSALACQGFAVHRYYQQELGTDPAAAPYRVEVGGEALERPWVDAVALAPEIEPGPGHIQEAPERAAFSALRQTLLAQPTATLSAPSLPAGAELVINGASTPSRSAQLPPGRHWVAVRLGGQIIHRERVELASGQELRLDPVIDPAELDELAARMGRGEGLVLLSEGVLAALAPLEEPVYLAVQGPDQSAWYKLDGAGAVRVETAARDSSGGAWVFGGGFGGGLLVDPDWYLENAGDGAPDSPSTTTAAVPALSLAAEWRAPWFAAGVGLDTALPLGRYHRLPVGEGAMRARVYPHLRVGVPYLRATAGWVSPSQIGLGLRPRLPLGDGFMLEAQGLYGLGHTRYRVGLPDVQASDIYGAWLMLGWEA
jgi:hypothetical protein